MAGQKSYRKIHMKICQENEQFAQFYSPFRFYKVVFFDCLFCCFSIVPSLSLTLFFFICFSYTYTHIHIRVFFSFAVWVCQFILYTYTSSNAFFSVAFAHYICIYVEYTHTHTNTYALANTVHFEIVIVMNVCVFFCCLPWVNFVGL